MSNYIDYKNIIEWANREMLCDEVRFWITFKEVKREDLLIKFKRYNNSVVLCDSKDNLIRCVMFDSPYYTNRKLANIMNGYYFSMNDVGKCHVTVMYKDLARDVRYFSFECDINGN